MSRMSGRSASPIFVWHGLLPGLVLLGLLLPSRLPAETLSDLLNDPKMNPKRFAGRFEYFEYEFNTVVQAPDIFLARKKGDCDDYACLADLVLSRKGFGTRLVQVQLASMVDHAVCYVTESKAYLDYNNRRVFFTLAHCRPSLREIAGDVADSLDLNWTSAFEFTFSGDTKEIVATVVKTAPPENDPPPGGKTGQPGKATGNSIKVGF